MADRYEERAREVVRRIEAEFELDPTEAVAAALREQDTWYAIDDPEHPAPTYDDGPCHWWLDWADDYKSHHVGDDIGRWLPMGTAMYICRHGSWPSFAKATYHRPLPPPPTSGRERG